MGGRFCHVTLWLVVIDRHQPILATEGCFVSSGGLKDPPEMAAFLHLPYCALLQIACFRWLFGHFSPPPAFVCGVYSMLGLGPVSDSAVNFFSSLSQWMIITDNGILMEFIFAFNPLHKSSRRLDIHFLNAPRHVRAITLKQALTQKPWMVYLVLNQ